MPEHRYRHHPAYDTGYPAAHYSCGGIKTDEHGRTSIKHLYAAGECASTGFARANRLASNSLLEAMVFAHRSYLDAVQKIGPVTYREDLPDWKADGTNAPKGNDPHYPERERTQTADERLRGYRTQQRTAAPGDEAARPAVRRIRVTVRTNRGFPATMRVAQHDHGGIPHREMRRVQAREPWPAL